MYSYDKKIFSMKSSEPLCLLKPLDGLSNSEDYWHLAMANHFMKELRNTPITLDMAHRILILYEQLGGVKGIKFDDSID